MFSYLTFYFLKTKQKPKILVKVMSDKLTNFMFQIKDFVIYHARKFKDWRHALSICARHQTASLQVCKSQKRIYRQRSYSLSRLPQAYKSHRWNDQSSLGAAPLVPVLVNLHVICHVEGTELLRGVFDLAAHAAPSNPAVPLSNFRKTYPPSHAPRMCQGGGGKIQFYYLHA